MEKDAINVKEVAMSGTGVSKKVELLSPAGDFSGLVGAINAGADAIYLGGTRFSARANAANFDDESLIKALRLAHLFKRRIYLTLNTLLKEKEFSDLYEFLCPLYEAGLDGIIIQDFGVLKFVRENFPALPIHASTQMNATHAYGAEFLKQNGVSRIIPARELSFEEIKAIIKEVDIELETFVHGAMCYSYSGRCLKSSILGGRSGNRGHCAQPCRLPYQTGSGTTRNYVNQANYPLSLKDMCAIDFLPELINAGISAFKIEGRMKKPEYTAGVTAIYRKYIDLYYEKGYEKGAEFYQVLEEDSRFLYSLYIRSEVSTGYYFQKNGPAMVTLEKPSYNESPEELLKNIRDKYLDGKLTKPVNGAISINQDEASKLLLSCDGVSVTVTGAIGKEAKSQPLLTESVNKQLRKTGETNFHFDELDIKMPENIFLPLKELNELRRSGLALLLEELLKPYQREAGGKQILATSHPEDTADLSRGFKKSAVGRKDLPAGFREDSIGFNKTKSLHAKVTCINQLESILGQNAVSRLYFEIDLLTGLGKDKAKQLREKKHKEKGELYAVLPPVLRTAVPDYFGDYGKIMACPLFDGVMIANIESYQWLKSINYRKPIVFDNSLYIWNKEARLFWREKRINEFCLPLELNYHELKEIPFSAPASLCVFGRIPMMVSANCIRKTAGECKGKQDFCEKDQFSYLTDRYHKQFPVYHGRKQCYNIIYNSVPLSLHDVILGKTLTHINTYRLDFTTETKDETSRILNYFTGIINGKISELPYKDYTTGHIKRGVL
ncbi:MAG: U32 family peptidase [Lachnospiraceae bacterium]|nr:U32 family peptidase [Lachnospiraceae bacterium]